MANMVLAARRTSEGLGTHMTENATWDGYARASRSEIKCKSQELEKGGFEGL